MPPRKKSKPAPVIDPNKKVPANLYVRAGIKTNALEFVASLGYDLSEYVEELLEVQMIRAGKIKPRTRVEPVEELLRPKTGGEK